MRSLTSHFFESMVAFSIALFALFTPTTYAIERDTTTTWEPDRFEGTVEDFLITEQNSLWIGQENRLSHFDAKEGYTHYYARDEIPNKILGVQLDNDGTPWVWGIGKALRQIADTLDSDEHEVLIPQVLEKVDVFHIAYFNNDKWNRIELPEILQDAVQYEMSLVQPSFQVHFDDQNTLWLTRKPDLFTIGLRSISPRMINRIPGVFTYDHSGWNHFTTKEGLANDLVWDINSDPDGSIWISTLGGISHFTQGNWVNYTEKDGLVRNEVVYTQRIDGQLLAQHGSGYSVFIQPTDNTKNRWIEGFENVAPLEIDNISFHSENGNPVYRGYAGLYVKKEGWSRYPLLDSRQVDLSTVEKDYDGFLWSIRDKTLHRHSKLSENQFHEEKVRGTVHKTTGEPIADAVLRLTLEDELIAWGLSDSTGAYDLTVLQVSSFGELQEKYPERETQDFFIELLIDGEFVDGIDLCCALIDDYNPQMYAIKLGTSATDFRIDDYSEETEHQGNYYPIVSFIAMMLLLFIKKRTSFFDRHTRFVDLFPILWLLWLYGWWTTRFEMNPLLMLDVTSVLWVPSLYCLIRFSLTDRIVPLIMRPAKLRIRDSNFYLQNAKAWSYVPLLPVFSSSLLMLRDIDDPAMIGPLIAIGLLSTFYSAVAYAYNTARAVSLSEWNLKSSLIDFNSALRLGGLAAVGWFTHVTVLVTGLVLSSHTDANSFAPYLLVLLLPVSAMGVIPWTTLMAILFITSIATLLLYNHPSRREFCIVYIFMAAVSLMFISSISMVTNLATFQAFSQQLMLALGLSGFFSVSFIALSLIGSLGRTSQQGAISNSSEEHEYTENRILVAFLCTIYLALTFIIFHDIVPDSRGSGSVEGALGAALVMTLVLWSKRRRRNLQEIIAQRTSEIEEENQRKALELEEARDLQISMLPKVRPDHAKLDIAFRTVPATEVGGDYFDLIETDDETCSIAVGDATGHGLRAGIVVTATKSLFQVLTPQSSHQEMFTMVSKTLRDMKMRRVNMALSLVTISDLKLTISSAGMPPAFLFRSSNQKVEEILIEGLPLGISDRAQYRTEERRLHPGDTLLLMSDGLPERLNEDGDLFDYERLQKSFKSTVNKSPEEICSYLLNKGEEWAGESLQDDDITLVVIRVK